jgi:hypothetical protein
MGKFELRARPDPRARGFHPLRVEDALTEEDQTDHSHGGNSNRSVWAGTGHCVPMSSWFPIIGTCIGWRLLITRRGLYGEVPTTARGDGDGHTGRFPIQPSSFSLLLRRLGDLMAKGPLQNIPTALLTRTASWCFISLGRSRSLSVNSSANGRTRAWQPQVECRRPSVLWFPFRVSGRPSTRGAPVAVSAHLRR